MFMGERLITRISRLLNKILHKGASSIESADVEAKTHVYPYFLPPGVTEFRAVLASEYDHAVQSQNKLTVLYVDLPDCPPERLEEIDVLLRSVTQKREKLFLYSPTCFAIILRGMGATEAAMLSLQAFNLVKVSFPEHEVRTNIAAYPEIVKNIAEFESRAPEVTKSSRHVVLK